MSRVAYAFGGVLGGSGIGRIAGHAARGVHRAGLLDRAVAWAADGDPVPRDRLTTVPLGEHASLLPYYYKDLAFDLISERAVGTPELLHGWNNMCLRTIRRVADHGGVTVVERASTHPAVQRELVEAEYRRHGVDEEFV
ncbi:MAG: hypothetical protein ABEH77_06205, partial [Halobacteriaceae archaeon]